MSINDGYMPGQTNNLKWAPSSMLALRLQSINSELNRKISVNYRQLLNGELEAIRGELAKRVNQAMCQISKDGTLKASSMKWFGRDSSNPDACAQPAS